MTNQSFYRMIQRTCTNGPTSASAMQDEIDSVDLSVYRRNHSCKDAQPVCGQTIASMCI
jgi:hypothetical protein